MFCREMANGRYGGVVTGPEKITLMGVLLASIMTLCGLTAHVRASDGKTVIADHSCANCHNLTGPVENTMEAAKKRKAPDLFYAGSKFQKGFLTDFLQNPSRLRPAGTVYFNNISFDGKKDVIQPPDMCPSRLSKEEAAAAADYLMGLRDPVVKPLRVREETFSIAKSRIIFEKSEACQGCHRYRIQNKIAGGKSAPVLYNAGSRLNRDWVYYFLKNPGYWIPKIWMPTKQYTEEELRLLTNFVMSMKE